jgi:hypothetical protein
MNFHRLFAYGDFPGFLVSEKRDRTDGAPIVGGMSNSVSNEEWRRFMDARDGSRPALSVMDGDVPALEVQPSSLEAFVTDEATYRALAETNRAALGADLAAIRQSPHRPHTALDHLRTVAGVAAGHVKTFAESEDSYVTVGQAARATFFALTPAWSFAVPEPLRQVVEHGPDVLLSLGNRARELARQGQSIDREQNGKMPAPTETGL